MDYNSIISLINEVLYNFIYRDDIMFEWVRDDELKKHGILEAVLDKEIGLPIRKTPDSAGYDFVVPKDITIPAKEIVLVPTGVKAKFPKFVSLHLSVRSSTPLKTKLILANGLGLIDADYYENQNNDGHIMFQLMNVSNKDVVLQKGTYVGQGEFNLFFKIKDDKTQFSNREGGHGSTDKNRKTS